jgi:hypothetical protein
MHGRPDLGYYYVHSAIDAHSRPAYSGTLDEETPATALAFWARAGALLAGHGITVERAPTENGSAYASHALAGRTSPAGHHTLPHTRPSSVVPRPQNERQDGAAQPPIVEEWAYKRLYTSEKARPAALSG